jgi:hypothetical protein
MVTLRGVRGGRTASAALVLVVVVLAGCSGSGGEDARARCRESPRRPPDQAFEAETTGGEAWALPFGPVPAEVATEWKLVWRITGEGDLEVAAVDPEGASHEPTAGPTAHGSSNFDRPGDEWGTFFEFPTPGCWKVIARRGTTEATLTVRVVE